MATSITYKHYGIVKNGVKCYYNKQFQADHVKSLEGMEFEETLSVKKKKVSDKQHAFYRGVIVQSCVESNLFSGWTKDDVHEFFQKRFLAFTDTEHWMDDEGKTKIKTIVKYNSTSSLNSKEMAEFITQVIQWLAERGVIILEEENYKY